MTKVNIQVEEQTREKLSSLGKKRETYDDIIQRLLSLDKTQGQGQGQKKGGSI